jgi:hypothetical protein
MSCMLSDLHLSVNGVARPGYWDQLSKLRKGNVVMIYRRKLRGLTEQGSKPQPAASTSPCQSPGNTALQYRTSKSHQKPQSMKPLTYTALSRRETRFPAPMSATISDIGAKNCFLSVACGVSQAQQREIRAELQVTGSEDSEHSEAQARLEGPRVAGVSAAGGLAGS